jgi:probable phosphoglycerate mutase
MALVLYLIRHAESMMNAHHAHLIGGRSSASPLSPLGVRQSEALAQRLRDEDVHFDAMHTSTALRTLQTATPVAHALHYPLDEIVRSQDLEELSQGEWEGVPRTKVYSSEIMTHIERDQRNFKAPGGESQANVEERMLRYLARSLPQEGTMALFTHGVAIKCLLRGITNCDQTFAYATSIDNASITQLRYERDQWWLLRVNDAAHTISCTR